MASGDVVGMYRGPRVPTTDGTNYIATFERREGGEEPAVGHLAAYMSDDNVADTYMDYVFILGPNYDSGGITVKIKYAMSSATSGKLRIGAAIYRINESSDDLDQIHTFAFNETTVDPVPSTSGHVETISITFTDGADMDSWAAGEMAYLRIRRETTDITNDTAAGDLEIYEVEIYET